MLALSVGELLPDANGIVYVNEADEIEDEYLLLFLYHDAILSIMLTVAAELVESCKRKFTKSSEVTSFISRGELTI